MTFHQFLFGLHPPQERLLRPLQWYFPLCFSSVVLASTFRSRKARLLCTIPIIALFSRFHKSYTGEPKADYPLSLWLMWLALRYIDISLLGPDDKFWKPPKAQRIGTVQSPSYAKETRKDCLRDGSFPARFKKSLSLWMTLRGVGWNSEIKHMRCHEGSRWSFLLQTLSKTVVTKMCLDVINYARKTLPYGGPVPRISLDQASLATQILLAWLPPVHIFVELMYLYGLGALIFVALKINEPRDWPYLFGKLSDSITVGQTWSRTWHQTLRRVCTFMVDPLTEFLGVPEKTSLHRNITLLIGFTTSGLIHYSGTCNLPYSPTHEKYFLFFFAQPFAIMFEDAVLAIGRKVGLKSSRSTRMVGGIWTVSWLTVSIRYLFLPTSLEDLYPIWEPKWVGMVVGLLTSRK